MKYLYCIYDSRAQESSPPFMAHNDDVAMRMYNHTLRENPYSSDYRLYRVCDYDDTKMSVKAYDFPIEVFSEVKDVN